MKPVIAFDVDGTLTDPRSKIILEHLEWFNDICSNYITYLITGSDLPKLLEQIPGTSLALTHGIFTCSGAQFWRPNLDEVEDLRKDFHPTQGLLDELNDALTNSPYPERAGNHIEKRVGMLNFSIPGRNSSPEQRAKYSNWDSTNGERKGIAGELKRLFPELTITVGGEISIDISESGVDKGRAIDIIRSFYGIRSIWFFGDKVVPDGNDWPVIRSMRAGDKAIQVYGPDDLIKLWGKIKTTNVYGKMIGDQQ